MGKQTKRSTIDIVSYSLKMGVTRVFVVYFSVTGIQSMSLSLGYHQHPMWWLVGTFEKALDFNRSKLVDVL